MTTVIQLVCSPRLQAYCTLPLHGMAAQIKLKGHADPAKGPEVVLKRVGVLTNFQRGRGSEPYYIFRLFTSKLMHKLYMLIEGNKF